METIAFLLLIVVIFILLSLKSNVSSKFADLNTKVDELSKRIRDLNSEQMTYRKQEKKPSQESYQHHAPTPVIETPKIKEERPIEPIRKEVIAEPPVVHTPEPVVISAPPVAPKASKSKPTPQQAPAPGFFERNPDLEKFIGENLANKIGIAILVLGIGFFVKYAIDQNWINEIGRVFIGILCGGILLGIAHKLRKTFAAFSSVLVGGGIAVLYFTIAIAFHEYKIFSQTAAFILMVGITAFTVVLSLGYNRIELAVLGILGGFGSPFMVSTGEGNYIVLFTYILILNAGMLVLAYYKKWKLINIICYVFTILIFGSWLSTRFDSENVSMISGALIFATLFYLVFFAMNIINNIKERTSFEALEIMMLLSNTFLYYSAGMIVLNNPIGEQFRGLFTAVLGIFNFVFAYGLYKNQRADRNLVFMLIGLVLTFISLAAPIQLKGNYITLFWAAEAVLLLWLSQKSGIRLIKVASVVVMGLMIISLLIDWKQIYIDANSDANLALIFNKGYITSVVALASLVITYFLLRNEKEDFLIVPEYRIVITVLACLFTYVAHFLELRHHVSVYVDSYAAQSLIIGSYNMFFILLLLLVEKPLNIPEAIRKIFPAWGMVAMGAYLFFYHAQTIVARDEYLTGTGSSVGIIFHYVLVSLLLAAVIVSLVKTNRNTDLVAALKNTHWWVYVFFFLFLASAGLDHIVMVAAYTDIESASGILTQNHKIGYPILWGLASFLLIAIGLKLKIKTLRIISLSLFLITLLKLFIADLKGISEGGKIAAFISLGILLLVVSFMYQRLKKLLLEDSPATETENVI